MTFWESLRIAVRALHAHKLRSLLTMLGIIIGVAAVITMLAIGRGAQVQVEEQIRTLGSNLLMVLPGAAREKGVRLAAGTRHTLTERDAEAIERYLPAVAVASPSVRGSAQIVNGNRNWNTVINGTNANYFIARDWPIGRGRVFSEQETASAAKVALLGETVVNYLFEDADPVGQTVRIANVPFTVVGVLASKGQSGTGRNQDNIVFVPISTAKLRLTGSAHQVSREAVAYILVKVKDAAAMARTEKRIKVLLRQSHRIPSGREDDFRVTNPAAAMAAREQATRTLTLLLASVASISLVVGGISIMNTMLVSVTERTREIGLRMALGARRRDVRIQFLLEAVCLCLVGGLFGVLIGLGTAVAVAKIAGWPVLIGPETIILSVVFAAAVGVFFGFYPAHKAARRDPIEARRSE
jgi:putative ABC transport system permease protein